MEEVEVEEMEEIMEQDLDVGLVEIFPNNPFCTWQKHCYK
jgi:hypothetical protein